ncbi:hypothetical protein FI667_g13905, partial [Globisporangium splendens]
MVLEADSDVDVSAIATRVLADLETLFDDHIVTEENEDELDDHKRVLPGISLDELSVAVNASIHRHQPRAVLPEKSNAAKPEIERGSDKIKRSEALLVNRERPMMPFANYQDILERKTQWFHRNVKADLRTSAPRRRKPLEPRCQGRTHSDSSLCSGGSKSSRGESSEDSNDESDEDGDAEWTLEDENNAPSPPSSFVARQRENANDTNLTKTPVVVHPTTLLRAVTIRDAFTQTTLKCDQSQQSRSRCA